MIKGIPSHRCAERSGCPNFSGFFVVVWFWAFVVGGCFGFGLLWGGVWTFFLTLLVKTTFRGGLVTRWSHCRSPYLVVLVCLSPERLPPEGEAGEGGGSVVGQ